MILEGWIRAKLEHAQSSFYPSDPNQYYFDNHDRFDFGEEYKAERVKFKKFIDKEENVEFLISFGYNEIGIKFNVVSRDQSNSDRLSIFKAALAKAVKGYRNFKEHFINRICPKPPEAKLVSPSLLIVLYGFFKGLNKREKSKLLKEMKSSMEDYTSEVKFILTNGKPTEFSSEEDIRATTIEELEIAERLDFSEILVVCDEVYLFVKHHLFARYFFFEDPSQSILTVAWWGFISSLKLQNLYYEVKLLSHDKGEFKEKLTKMKTKRIPSGLDRRREELLALEKRQTIIEDDLREFVKLSNEIYNAINSSQQSTRLWLALQSMRSLPHSLDQAYAMLELNKLGRFSSLMRDLQLWRNELNTIEVKLNRTQLVITFSVLGALVLLVLIFKYLGFEIGFIADSLQILTFVVAIILLLIRH